MGKKGQIALFIILGIVIVVITGLLFMLKGETSRSDVEVDRAVKSSLDVGPIKVFVDSCIKDVVNRGLINISAQGGYYDVPEPKSGFVPYYFHLGDVYFPSKGDIEGELSSYIEAELLDCLGNFETFRTMGFSFEIGQVSVNIVLNTRALVNVNYPIDVKRGQSSTKIEEFQYTQPFNFDRLYGILDSFRIEQEGDMGVVPAAFLANIASSNGFSYSIEDIGEETYAYTLTFNDIMDTSLDFRFAGKYT